jgi:hypothetical protein
MSPFSIRRIFPQESSDFIARNSFRFGRKIWMEVLYHTLSITYHFMRFFHISFNLHMSSNYTKGDLELKQKLKYTEMKEKEKPKSLSFM